MLKGNYMIRRILLLALLAVSSIITGCASLPSPEQMRSEISGFQLPKVPEPNKAMIYVVRPASVGALIRFNVFVDDQEAKSEMGYTRGSQYIYFSVPVGEHKIYSKAENWAEINVTAKANDIIYIQQEPSMGLIMARNNLSSLEDYQGKYHVKTLTVGTIIKTEK
jgi:hypothetical protein